MKLVLAVARCR